MSNVDDVRERYVTGLRRFQERLESKPAEQRTAWENGMLRHTHTAIPILEKMISDEPAAEQGEKS